MLLLDYSTNSKNYTNRLLHRRGTDIMHKLIIVLFFVICTQPVWSVDNQGQLFVPDNIELALNDLTDTAHYELVKEYALSLQKSDYDQFIARLENKRTVSSVQGLSFVILQMISMG